MRAVLDFTPTTTLLTLRGVLDTALFDKVCQ
jgi:hypothetical protein